MVVGTLWEYEDCGRGHGSYIECVVDVQGVALCFRLQINHSQLGGNPFDRGGMSRAAKITLGVSVVACVGTIWGVHYMQRREREVGFLGFFFWAASPPLSQGGRRTAS